ncbi:MAG TPA: helix-turn-helix domain-containing protein [Jatrophihabitantaceae bacterium]|nr:helix-turn-helix domain-containing protein [Jatrophihabitantaceae bacterium]
MSLNSVAAVIVPGVAPFELGVACEGFGVDRIADGVPRPEFAVVSVEDAPVPTSNGFSITTPHRLDVAEQADLVIVTATFGPTVWPAELLGTLRRTVARGARVMSICNGAFALGEAGLLDGRDCTTHWRHAAQLAEEFPAARVNPNVLYVCDGPVLTSAGSAAGLDLCLHLIREEHGVGVANVVARRMVMPPFREGGQAQFVGAPIRACEAETLAPLLDEITSDLATEHTVESMAAQSAMSLRTFARRFRDETGTTPHVWLTNQRVHHAREMLERGDDPIETVATRSGFGTAAMLRHHFTRLVGTSPATYRRTFRG